MAEGEGGGNRHSAYTVDRRPPFPLLNMDDSRKVDHETTR